MTPPLKCAVCNTPTDLILTSGHCWAFVDDPTPCPHAPTDPRWTQNVFRGTADVDTGRHL